MTLAWLSKGKKKKRITDSKAIFTMSEDVFGILKKKNQTSAYKYS